MHIRSKQVDVTYHQKTVSGCSESDDFQSTVMQRILQLQLMAELIAVRVLYQC